MLCLGLDLGSSGIRGVVLGETVQARHSVPIMAERRRDPAALWQAVAGVLDRLPLHQVACVAVAGTSGSILAVNRRGEALGPLSLYGDPADPECVNAIAAVAPVASPARGHASPLGRAMALRRLPDLCHILHEADWIAGRLCGRFGFSDENNALKTGYDPVVRAWPDWIRQFGILHLLPRVVPPGTPIAPVSPRLSARFGFPPEVTVVAGTTDGCASFLAAGADAPGDAVTVLGSTLTLKILSPVPVCAPAFGVYSHRLWDTWLAGGASNAGGAALAAFFTPVELAALSAGIDPGHTTGLGFYPLPRPGERFPINDPALPPRLSPRPADDSLFLHGMLEGLAEIEAHGYSLLARLGAPAVTRITTLGGGAANAAWTAIRARRLGVPVRQAPDATAAHGAAMLAAGSGQGKARPGGAAPWTQAGA